MKCKGCGVELQNHDPQQLGYTPKENADMCQRCFRLVHYGKNEVNMREGIETKAVLKAISQQEGLLCWVIDAFDFEAGMIDGLPRHFANRKMVVVATKRDLLPRTLSEKKLTDFIYTRLKQQHIVPVDIVLTGKNETENRQGVMDALKRHRIADKPILVFGKANVGKSSLLNVLQKSSKLTTSRFPGTTIEMNEIEIEGIPFIDTPGLQCDNSMLLATDEVHLKQIVPQSCVKPMIYQCYEDQSFAIGGLVRLDFKQNKSSVVFYVSNQLNIHRGKCSTADELWRKHYGETLVPTANYPQRKTVTTTMLYPKMDIVIDGLGWVCVQGDIRQIQISVPKSVRVTYRKAMC